jgi:signal transduction histidine kinase
MSFAALKQPTQTLRFRLMAWNAVVVLLTSLGILVGVREGLRLSLISEMDQVLRQDAIEIGLAVREQPLANLSEVYDGLNRKARGHHQDGWFVQLLDLNHNELFSSENTPRLDLPPDAFAKNLPISSNGHRVLEDRAVTLDNQRLIVRLGASMGFLARDMQRIDGISLVIVLALLIIAPLGGYWLAGRAIKPLADIIFTMNRLRADQLRERLPLRSTGDELDQLALTFNRLLDRIAAHLEQHRDSLANAAHELRTPLAAIRSSIEVCLNEDRPSEDYRELLGNLIEECAALEMLVNQLLLLAETEADRLKIVGNYLDLHNVVERCVDMFQGVADHMHVRLTLRPPQQTFVEGNRHHLRQLMNNLVDNALKFTPEGGQVDVSLERDAARQLAVLTVRDTGAGISEEELPHIFERFYRGDKARQRNQLQRGTGLGLCICESVVRAHGGEIHVTSKLGQGTTFTVYLPLLSPDRLAIAQAQAGEQQPSGV